MFRFYWGLLAYFIVSLALILTLKVDLSAVFYPLYFLILPLYWIGLAVKPFLVSLGLWSKHGSSGWINYAGPTIDGLVLIALFGIVATIVVIFFSKRRAG